jgi:putative drug exporter of the RND superfamily
VVTSAAVIMVAVFSIFATLSTIDLKLIGVGLASAVLIDATVVRGVLVPAAGPARRAHLVPAQLGALAGRPAARAGPGGPMAAASAIPGTSRHPPRLDVRLPGESTGSRGVMG